MKKNIGSISILVLMSGLTFAAAIGGLVTVTAIQQNNAIRTEIYERALSVAEAGADYYKWHLSHDNQDFTDGTNQPGPYVHPLNDPYGNTEGTFSLMITPPASGSSIITIESTGWLNSHPEIKRTIVARYGKPSLAKYAFLQNANVWYGSKITIHGKVFANGGIRMDGNHDSTVQSSKATYTCGSETGCSPATTKPGVWGDGGPSSLWQFPVPAVDFTGIAADFAQMKASAQQNGTYLAKSNSYGYHIVFNSNGTYTVSRVTNASSKKGWSVEEGCQNLTQNIQNEVNVGTFSIAQKPIIFAEDHLWVEGIVNGKATVAAARFPLDVNKMNIWIPDNITYVEKDGNTSLGLIAQNDIIFALSIPQDFEVNAALLAQKGKVIRHNYKSQGCSHLPEAVRQTLTIYGSIISNLKSYWSYGQGNAGFGSDPVSGFSQREIYYDNTLYFTPPPFFPTQNEYEFISWSEE